MQINGLEVCVPGLKKQLGLIGSAKTIREEDLQAAVLTAINDIFNKKMKLFLYWWKVFEKL